MTFEESPLEGCLVMTPTLMEDDRGFFSRLFDQDILSEKLGAPFTVRQINNSLSHKKGTWRGLHYQAAPKGEVKYLRCVRGAVLDVVVDLREGSPTYLHSFCVELTAENRKVIVVPKGFAHGFLSLEDNSEVIYAIDETYSRDHERIIRWNDPAVSLGLPFEPIVISEKDRGAADFNKETHASGYTL